MRCLCRILIFGRTLVGLVVSDHRESVLLKESNMTDRTELIHVGFDNSLALNRVIAVASPTSAPAKRMVHRAKQQERVVDLTSGRRTKAVVVLENDWVALIAITPETFTGRIASGRYPSDQLST